MQLFSRSSSEKEIEHILTFYPYLIDKELIDGSIQTQYQLTIGEILRFVDMIYQHRNAKISIIELKKNLISTLDISQILEYRNSFVKHNPNFVISAFLVGLEIKLGDLQCLQKNNILYRQLFRDIPNEIKICSKCRKGVKITLQACEWCGNSQFIS